MTNLIEDKISISLEFVDSRAVTFHTFNESSTILDLKEKLYEIHGYRVHRQRIIGRFPENTALGALRNDEKLVNGGKYVVSTSLRGGARTKHGLNDPHRQFMNIINNRIPE